MYKQGHVHIALKVNRQILKSIRYFTGNNAGYKALEKCDRTLVTYKAYSGSLSRRDLVQLIAT